MARSLPRTSKELHFTGALKAARPAPRRITTARGQLPPDDDDDDTPTVAIERGALDAAVRPILQRSIKRGARSEAQAQRAVPHFRSAAAVRAQHADPPTVIIPRPSASSAGGFPLSVWLFAAVVAGIVSYQVTPQAARSFAEVVHSHATP